jgi:hypothetical protein
MRHGYRSSVIADDGKFVGFNLGADFCAEHEWGIDGIREAFGMPEASDRKSIGIARRAITKVPPWLKMIEHKDDLFLACDPYSLSVEKTPESLANWLERGCGSELHLDGQSEIAAAWSEDDFCIKASKSQHKDFVRELNGAFARKDVAIFMGGGFFIENPGLCIAIASAIPEEGRRKWEDVDREKIETEDEAKASGVEERLRKAGKKWFCLAPKRFDGVLKFWLNPMEQQENNCGWFTVQQLDQWVKGKGPIPRASGTSGRA